MKFKRPAFFHNNAEFRAYLESAGIDIGLSDDLSPLAGKCACFGKTLGNRWCVLPMEGWDCDPDGSPSAFTRRRWLRFACGGAKLLFGVEAAAVMRSGKSNPHQLVCAPHTEKALTRILAEMREVHREKFGTDADLAIGLQLTHSGRFAHPDKPDFSGAKTAYAHPLLDRKFGCSPANVVSDEEVADIVAAFAAAAKTAQNAGFDFVDLKHAHGYLGHEFLTAFDRPGSYGGSFENRTRFFREIAAAVKRDCPGLALSARISLFDIFPFVRGRDGIGEPMEWHGEYPYAFGGDGSGLAMDPDLTETVRFAALLKQCGVEMICATLGSPYYNVHLQRPAYYPVCDGYLPPWDPLLSAACHFRAVRRFKQLCPDLRIVGSGYTCLQEFLPAAAAYELAHGYTDFAGIGRMALSYPEMCGDVIAGVPLAKPRICRTFGDCTNAPRNGLISGCYPLDDFYKNLPEAFRLRELKKEGLA